ncbi:MAG: hypothetical protein ABIH83_03765 [Candidatus Micrarchaeota archaeon]
MYKDDEGKYSKGFIKSIKQGLADIKAGRTISHEELVKKLGFK